MGTDLHFLFVSGLHVAAFSGVLAAPSSADDDVCGNGLYYSVIFEVT